MAKARKKAGAPLRERDGNQSRLTGFGFSTKEEREQSRLTGFGFLKSDGTDHGNNETQEDNKENELGILVGEHGLQEDNEPAVLVDKYGLQQSNEPGVPLGEDEIPTDEAEKEEWGGAQDDEMSEEEGGRPEDDEMSEEEGDDEVVEIVEDGIKIVDGELVWEE